MKKMIIVLLSLFLLAGLTSCRTFSNEGVGMVAGGVAGGLLGSQIGGGSGRAVAIAGGTLLGAIIGGRIGSYMDRQDQMEVYQALESNRNGAVRRWHNPNTGNDYSVVPTNTFERGDQPCREYTTTAIIGGKKEKVYGTACRTADGSWKIQNSA